MFFEVGERIAGYNRNLGLEMRGRYIHLEGRNGGKKATNAAFQIITADQ